MVKTLAFGRIKLVLDSEEIFPDDPGAGAPAMVYSKDESFSASYNCARDVGELMDGSVNFACILTHWEVVWLNEQEDVVWAFIDEHTPLTKELP